MTESSQKLVSAKMEAKSGNIKKPVIYQQKFRKEWKLNPLLRDWVCEDEEDKNRAYCLFCKCNLLSKFHDLLTHAKTNKHLRAARLFEPLQEGCKTKDAKGAFSAGVSSASARISKGYDDILKEVKVRKEQRPRPLGVRKLSTGDISEDGDCMYEYNIHSDEEEEIAQIVTDVDNEILMSTTSGIPKKLQIERVKVETEYFRQKAIYFSKLAENSRIQRTMLILQSRKLHLEVQKLQRER